MKRILISTLPVSGHINPAVAVAQKLSAAGYQVVFALPEQGAALLPDGAVCNRTPATFSYSPTRVRIGASVFSDIRRIKCNIHYVLADWTRSQLDALRTIARIYQPHLIVSDCLHLGPLIIAREREVPSAVLGVTPYRNLISGSGPTRFGWGPARTRAATIFYDAINCGIIWGVRDATQDVIDSLCEVAPCLDSMRLDPHLSAFNFAEKLATVYLQCSTPLLEDRPKLLMANKIQFIGPMNDRQLEVTLHSRKKILSGTRQGHLRRKVAFVTWGTMQPNAPDEFLSIVRRLSRNPDWTAVVAAPSSHIAQAKSLLSLPNVVVTSSFGDFLPSLAMADVFVSNGGFGGVKAALSFGLPVVCLGDQDDKPDVCGRLNRSGAGLGYSWRINGKLGVKAVLRVAREASFSAAACAVAAEFAAFDRSGNLEHSVEALIGPP